LLISGSSCRKEYIVEERITEPNTSQSLLKNFQFFPEQNLSFINDTVSLDINGNVISGSIPYYTSLKSLKPSFETDAASIEVAGIPQESGVTAQDFTHPVYYNLADKNGNKANYVVNLVNFTGLPVIKINTDGSAPINSKEDYVQAHITIDGAGSYPDFDGEMKIKGHGNSTWTFPKKPYKFKLDKKEPLLGEPEDKEWILLANYTDKTQIRNETAFFMGRSARLTGRPTVVSRNYFSMKSTRVLTSFAKALKSPIPG
jgi:hypothetical protein